MSFPSSVLGNRQFVLLCVRLLVLCVTAWSTPQTGIDEVSCPRAVHDVGDRPIACDERERIALG